MTSIIVPAFNAAKTLRTCLDSIFSQTQSDVEVIVVNDGSTDGTADVAKSFLPRITYFEQSNQGAAAARNTGAAAARGDYLIFCDADITLAPTALQELADALQLHPEASYSYSAFRFGFKTFPMLTFDPHRLKQFPYIHTTSLIRRAHFPGFDPSLKRFQDWDLWLTMLEQGHSGVGVASVLFTVKPGGTMSSWVPAVILRNPLFSWVPAVRAYHQAERVIRTKHNL